MRNLPWRVWTGTAWEKHEGGEDANSVPESASGAEGDIEACLPTKRSSSDIAVSDLTKSSALTPSPAITTEDEQASSSVPPSQSENLPWFESQAECAICLCEFAKGDKVRVLPCQHIFHLHEVDEWLIQRKKLVSSELYVSHPVELIATPRSVRYVRQTSLSHHLHHPYARTRIPRRIPTMFHPSQH